MQIGEYANKHVLQSHSHVGNDQNTVRYIAYNHDAWRNLCMHTITSKKTRNKNGGISQMTLNSTKRPHLT